MFVQVHDYIVYVYMYVGLSVCVCKPENDAKSLDSYSRYMWSQVLSVESRVHWYGQSIYLACSGITEGHRNHLQFTWVPGDLNSVSQACRGSIWSNEPLWEWIFSFMDLYI